MKRSMIRALLLVACCTATAEAQLGGLIKKAAGKMTEKAAEKAAPSDEGKPLVGDPMSASTLDAVLKGLDVERQANADAEKAHAAAQAKLEEWRAAREASTADREKYEAASSKQRSCVGDQLRVIGQKREEEMPQRFQAMMRNANSDPKAQQFVKQYAALSQQMGQASQKGDAKEMERLTGELNKLMGIDAAKDSAAAYQKCGQPLPVPASVAKTNALEKEADALRETERKTAQGISARAADAAGLAPKEYARNVERLWAWWNTRKERNANTGITKDEAALFSARQSDIQKVASLLR